MVGIEVDGSDPKSVTLFLTSVVEKYGEGIELLKYQVSNKDSNYNELMGIIWDEIVENAHLAPQPNPLKQVFDFH